MYKYLTTLALENMEIFNVNEIGSMFMKDYPTYPVTQLKIAPREAYIAPTENIFHDATSFDKKHCDITFTMLGNFSLTNLQHS